MTNAEARFNKIHIRKVYACLAVTCHLHFWQNDRDFLRATVVTRGWNGYRNKSQHRKSTPEKKILPPFQQGFEPATFQSRVRCSNHWAIPAPKLGSCSTENLYWIHKSILAANDNGGLFCKLQGIQSSRQEQSSWGRCSTEKRICTVFVHEFLQPMIPVMTTWMN